MLNQIVLETRVVKNNGLKYSSKDQPYLNLILVFETLEKKDSEWKAKGNFIKACLFAKKAEALKDVKPGTPLIISGKIEQNKWESKEGEKRSEISLKIEEFHFIKNKHYQKEKVTS